MTIVVQVSDAKASRDAATVLATYSLGSCIGVAAYDPVARVGGMLHFQLPSASLDPERAKAQPQMYGDSGLAWLLDAMAAHGADKRRVKVKLAGAAQMLNDVALFNIGRRNHVAIRKVLWQHGLFVDGEDVGGSTPRNLYLAVADGAVTVKATGRTKVL